MEKLINDLQIVEQKKALPSIEIDVDSTVDGNHREIIEKALVAYAQSHGSQKSSVYDYVGPSFNFGKPTQSVFFCVANSLPLLKHLHKALSANQGIKVRFSDYLGPSQAQLCYHIEKGEAWRRDDMVTFSLLD